MKTIQDFVQRRSELLLMGQTLFTAKIGQVSFQLQFLKGAK
jgi:hypothetical protein